MTEPRAVPAPVSRSTTPGPRFLASAWLQAGLIVVAVLLAFSPALGGAVLWDDGGHLTRPDLQSLDGLRRIWFELGATQQYYPLLHTAFWLEHQLWGEALVGYHLVNLVWHAGSAILFGLLLRRWDVPGAWLAAWFFALHPVAVESVAWISEQKNTLSALFYLGAAYLYWTFRDTGRRGAYAGATLFFVLALLTKTVTATLPAALLVVAWWRDGRLDVRRDVRPLLPWFGLALAAGTLTAWFEHAVIGAQGEAFALGPVERLLVAGRVVWFYLGKLLWPHPLIFIYPRWPVDAAAAGQYLYPLAAAAALAFCWRLARRGRRAPLAVALLYGGTLFPVLGFLNVYPFVYSFVADHFQYHASLAMFAGLAAGCVRAASGRLGPAPRFALAVAGLAVLGGLSWRQSHDYRDQFALYEATLRRNPGAWMAHTNLGIALVEAGRPAAALPHYREALRLRPQYPEGEHNLGYALHALGRTAEALPHFRRAVELNPDYLEARNNLADALMATGEVEAGLELFRETLARYPGNPDAHFNCGLALGRAGRPAEALPHLEQAVRLAPGEARYVLHVGTALLLSGRGDEALPHFQRAADLDPGSAAVRYAFGRALLERGRPVEAIAQLREAVKRDPGFVEAHLGLATALQSLGRVEEARQHREEAARWRQEPGRGAPATGR